MKGIPRFTGIDDGGYLNKKVEVTPMNGLRIAETTRLCGQPFGGYNFAGAPWIDTSFWTTSVDAVGPGTFQQTGGELILSTTAAANTWATVSSVRRGRYIGASANMFRGQIQVSAGAGANVRRWGAFTSAGGPPPAPVNGAYFEFVGSALAVVTCKAGAPTSVAQANWNGGNAFTMDTNVHVWEIYWTNGKVYFTIDDKLMHTVSASSAPWADTCSLNVGLQNINNANNTVTTLKARVATISRLGPSKTRPQHKNITTDTTTVCKYGAGTIHGFMLNSAGTAGGGSATAAIYDGISAAGVLIATINTANTNLAFQPFGIDGLDFYDGLCIVTATGGTDANITIVYE